MSRADKRFFFWPGQLDSQKKLKNLLQVLDFMAFCRLVKNSVDNFVNKVARSMRNMLVALTVYFFAVCEV